MHKDITVLSMLCMLVARSIAASYASAMIVRHAEIDGWQHLIRHAEDRRRAQQRAALAWVQIE